MFGYMSGSPLHGALQNRTRIFNITKDNLQSGLKYVSPPSNSAIDNEIITQSCTSPKSFSLLIEHLHEPIEFNTYIGHKSEEPFFDVELTTILYQIYGPLSALETEYTHYDLHTKNVLLYKIPDNKYIQMIYMVDGTEYKFYTNYVVKIIDYGRSYFRGNDTLFKVLDNMCKEGGDPLSDQGIGYTFSDKELNKYNHYISSRLNNISHDLRCAEILKHTYGKYMDAENPLSKKMHFILNNVTFTGDYGTPPLESTTGNAINNVSDMASQLLELMKIPQFIKENKDHYESMEMEDHYESMELLGGTMTIYCDKSNKKDLVFDIV
jgi:hypothetical protein